MYYKINKNTLVEMIQGKYGVTLLDVVDKRITCKLVVSWERVAQLVKQIRGEENERVF